MADDTTALRLRIQRIDERVAELMRRREKLAGALEVLEEDDDLLVAVVTPPIVQQPTRSLGPRVTVRERPDGQPTLPEVIVGVVREAEGQTTSEVADQVLARTKGRINSDDPRRVILTRIGQLVSGDRLLKDDEKRLYLPTHTLALNGNGHH